MNIKNIEKKSVTQKLLEIFTSLLNELKFFDSESKNRINTLVSNIKKPPFLFGTAFNILY
jgi:hypothetical protein